MDDLYREHILDHYQHPRCKGAIVDPDLSFEDANPLCGDRIRMDFRISGDTLAEVKFSGHGCSISQAAASMLCEFVEGRKLEDIKKLGREDMLEMLGIELGPVRLKCALLALKTLKAGIYGVNRWPGEDEDDA